MNYSGDSPSPSATDERSTSIDPTKHISYAPEPTVPPRSYSGLIGYSEPLLTATGQRSVPLVQADVPPIMMSTNQISDRGLNQTNFFGQAPGFSGDAPSLNDVIIRHASNVIFPTLAGFSERESDEAEPDNQQDLVGLSIVGRNFKQVNPEVFYVDDDDDQQQEHVVVSMVVKKFKPVNLEAYDVEDDDDEY
ncbi:hypothetical protein Hanom_Chr11g01063881 [Helianthus anomalus]